MLENPRPDSADMTEREMLIELIEKARALEDALTALSQNPMLAAMVPGGLL